MRTPSHRRSILATLITGAIACIAVYTTACEEGEPAPPEPATSAIAQPVTIACLGNDDCGQGLECVCGAGGCGCGVATDSTCSQCQGDGDCGDGQCCYQGACIAANDRCACGQVGYTMGGSDAPGCPNSQGLIQAAESIARSNCPSSCGGAGSGCEGDDCSCSASFPSENVRCEDHTVGGGGGGSGSGSSFSYAIAVATVCSLCQGPPPPDDPCDDIRVKINDKQMEITKLQREIALLTQDRDANAAARDSWQSAINQLNGLENRIETGQFGDNILVTTTGHAVSMVSDAVAIGKAAKFSNNVKCTGQKVCNILRVNRERGFTMSVTHTLKSDITSRGFYTPVYEAAAAKATGALANGQCPQGGPGAPPPAWTDWVPLYKDFTWAIGCYTAQYRTQEVGENRLNAIGNRNTYRDKVIALEAKIAQKNQALGVANKELADLQQQLADCLRNEGCGSGSGM